MFWPNAGGLARRTVAYRGEVLAGAGRSARGSLAKWRWPFVLGVYLTAVAGMARVLSRRMKSSHVAVGTCHVLPNALFRWYSVGSCVILAVCEPENPIICSRIDAGARLVVPCCDVTRYLV